MLLLTSSRLRRIHLCPRYPIQTSEPARRLGWFPVELAVKGIFLNCRKSQRNHDGTEGQMFLPVSYGSYGLYPLLWYLLILITVQHFPGLKIPAEMKKITDQFYKSRKARHKMSWLEIWDFQSLHIEIFFAVAIYSIGKTGNPRNLCSFPSAIWFNPFFHGFVNSFHS